MDPSNAIEGEAATESPPAQATASPPPQATASPPPAPTGEAAIQPSTEASVPEGSRRFMFPVKCTKCGGGFEVPFNPDPNRPILCRTCRPVYPAKCATCGKECQVPFKVPPGRQYRCRTCEAMTPPPPRREEKPKDPARQAAKDAVRAVFKEVGNREPTPEQSARIVALCRELYFGGGPVTSAPPRAVGAQPTPASGSATAPPLPKTASPPRVEAAPPPLPKVAIPPSTAPASTPPQRAEKPKDVRPESARQGAAHRAVVSITQLKVSQPIRPDQLPRDVLPPEGKTNVEIELVFALSSAAGKPVLPIRARFSSRNYRRALKAIDEHGEDATILLQGLLTGGGELLAAGIAVQGSKAARPKETAKARPPSPAAEKVPSASEVGGTSAIPAPPFVVRPGERIGRWIVLRELAPKGGVRQIHCRCRTCGFGADHAADELLAPVLPLCRRCD